MKEPVDHIRRPTLPWRDTPAMTECGMNADSVKTLTREEFFVRLKDFGSKRTAILTCMTCAETAKRHGTWNDDPRLAMQREIAWETPWRGSDRGELLRDELLAIAALIEAHREEFDAHLNSSHQRRAWIQQKADHAASKQRSRRYK